MVCSNFSFASGPSLYSGGVHLIMRFSAFLLCLFFWLQQPTPCAGKSSQPQKQQPQSVNQPANQDQRGAQDSPVFVKVVPAPKTQAEINQEAEERQRQSSRQWWTIVMSAILAVIALGQAAIYWYQAIQLRRTVESAGEQSKAMERHIGESARAATAMENIVATIEAGNKAVMRAYLTVIIGNPLYQERRPAQSDLKFEGRPSLVNTGNTQARKVRIRIAADIVPNPIPADFGFPLPEEDQSIGDATVAARQSYTMGGVVNNFVPDGEVASIKEGAGKCLCVWGVVTYEDIFGDSHTTTFGQQLTWLPGGKAFGYYIPGQNDAD
jgi:hypothetical protein